MFFPMDGRRFHERAKSLRRSQSHIARSGKTHQFGLWSLVPGRQRVCFSVRDRDQHSNRSSRMGTDVAAVGLFVFSIVCLIVSLRLRRLGDPDQ